MSCGMHTSSCAAGCFLLDDQILGICIFCLHDFPLNISPAQIVLELMYIVVQVKMLTPEARQLRSCSGYLLCPQSILPVRRE
jgi:hypothetical protein